MIFCKYQFLNGGHLGFQNGEIWIRSGMRDQLLKNVHTWSQNEGTFQCTRVPHLAPGLLYST